MSKNYHPYHLVDYSPWPYTLSCGAFMLTLGGVIYFHYNYIFLFILGLLLLFTSMTVWFSDITSEATFQGLHSLKVQKGLKLGMMMFIMSEICFFFSFFWAFFNSSLSPSMELGCSWPPIGMEAINPFAVPLLNTAILLGSGATVTWAHHSIVSDNSKDAMNSLGLTMFLGAFFTFVQMLEYLSCPFSLSDSCFGSTFFVATGFHGLHVLIGTMFLLISWLSLTNFHFTFNHHFGFEASAWYWHFVDVVWLFLFVCIYWWGS